MSEGTVLYLLGAGASAKTLPVSGSMAKSIDDFIQKWAAGRIDSYLKTKFQGTELPKHEDYKREFFEAAHWAKGIASRYGSFDTYARQLHIRKNAASFRKLKAFISAYFVAIQGVNGIDYRYDMFLGDALRPSADKPVLPETIRIISWNYDLQLEASYFGFCRNSNWTYEYLHGKVLNHLNGWSGSVINEGFSDDYTIEGIDAIVRAVQRYHEYMNEPTKDIDINFAFERPVPGGLTLPFQKLYENVETLIVIGYSFPVLNRKVDRELFAAMRKLKNIHVQVTPEYRSEVSSTLAEMSKNLPITHRDYLDRFYIPEEANVGID